jgi:hypothetical protein
MTEALAHTVNGITIGDDGSGTITYELVESPGLEDFATNGGTLDATGADGSPLAPLWIDVGGWTEVVEIWGGSRSDWISARDTFKRATLPFVDGSRLAETEFDIVYQDEDTKTIFARITNRKIPQDPAFLVDYFGEASVQFTAADPFTYGPEVTYTLALNGDHDFTPAGWVASKRWEWIAHGPVVNPRLTFTIDGMDDPVVLRFVGSVADGQNLHVKSTPHELVTTVGGPSFNRYTDFDGGNHNVPAPFDLTLADVATNVKYEAASGTGNCTFTYRTAYL